MKSDAILRRAPGIDSWQDLAVADDDRVRGLLFANDLLYALVGTTLSRITEGGTVTTCGTIPGGERVRMVANADGDFAVWRPFNNTAYKVVSNAVTLETDPMFAAGAASPGYLDGYLVYRRPDTNQFFNSGLNAFTYNGLDIASAEGKPGKLIGLHVDHRELILAKAASMELWYNAANSPGSPFSRSPDGFLEIGCAAGESLGSQDNSPFWIANDLTIRRLSGSTAERVSQHGIEGVLARVLVDDAYTAPYFHDGHLCIAFIFPSAGRTLVYDCTTKQWHERDSLGYGAWRPSHIVQAWGGRQYVGDRVTGKIGILNPDTFTEFDEPQRVRWTYQPVYAEGARAVHKRLGLSLNVGNGLPTGQGSNPLATLKISDDGGNVFRTHTTQELGRQGKYMTSVDWWKLGISNNRVYALDVTDPVKLFTFDTQLEAEGARL
jgi:hypothetical protein